MYANKGDIYANRRRKRPYKITPQAKAVIIAIVLVVMTVSAIAKIGSDNIEEYDNRLAEARSNGLGNLEEVIIPDDIPEIKVNYTGFNVSFNPSHHQPNYVSWELTAEEACGDVPRDSKFRTDPDVFGCASDGDYRRSGYDRGHMAPAADMKWSAEAMADCHFFTNICPQSHSLNGGRWSSLEKKCREWVNRDSTLVIICGPILSDMPQGSIGTGVTVPSRFFKVVLAPYANPPRAIGFIMANAVVPDGLEALAVTVDEVESATGFDFFSSLPDDIEEQVEASANFRIWDKRPNKKRQQK